MRARSILLALFIVGVIYYVTTHPPQHIPFVSPEGAHSTGGGSLDITEASAASSYDAEEQNNIAVYKKALPAVVNITSTAVAFDFFYGPVPQQGQGSGFILDKDGHILTNFHVIDNARQLEVTLSDRRKFKAEIIGSDPSHDLAVIQIHAPNLTPSVLGDSKNLIVGQKVFAIGNPFGLSGTMTRGIISSIRSIRGYQGAAIDESIQTDAAINPGNSGGPLLNSRGEVIGINTMIATGGAEQSSGVGFAIPINAAKAVLNDLVAYGKVRRPSLGVSLLPIGPELANELGLPADSGVLIMRVSPGGAAERAGLKGGDQQAYLGNTPILIGGDLIVAIDGQDVTTPQDVAQIMNGHKSGDAINVTIYREKRKMQVRVTLSEVKGTAT